MSNSLNVSASGMTAKVHGFTLIEMMITVAILGILATIALPSYTEYVRKGERSQARTAIMELMTQQERYFTHYNTYAALTLGQTGTEFKTWTGDGGLNGASHKLKAEACTGQTIAQCVKITASPVKADAEVGDIWLQSNGQKSCTGTKKEQCWK